MASGTGIANGFISVINGLASASYIITTCSLYWLESTQTKDSRSGFKEYVGLWEVKKCQIQNLGQVSTECTVYNPFDSLSMSSRQGWNIFSMFAMPVACVLSIFATLSSITALPQLRKFNTKPTCLMAMTGVFMLIAGAVGIVCGSWVSYASNNNEVKIGGGMRNKGRVGRAINALAFNVSWATILTLVTGIAQFLACFYAIYKVYDRKKSDEPEREGIKYSASKRTEDGWA